MIKTAVIMAAGLGTRFGDRTELIPKSYIEVNGVTMIIRSIETLIKSGIERIIIGIGYKQELFETLKKDYPQIECIFSPLYAETNSMWTLYNCHKAIGTDDFLLLESDLIFEQRAITELISDNRKNIALTSNVIKFQDQYFFEHNSDLELVNCSTIASELNICGELVGIYKINTKFFDHLKKYYAAIMEQQPKLGYEFGILHIAQSQIPMNILKINELKWYEIDDEKDLMYAEEYIVKNL